MANSLWPDEAYAILPAFATLIEKQYGAGITAVNFQTAHEQARLDINAWVEAKTNDKIKEIIQPGMIDGEIRLALVNAIYFKGDWLDQFDRQLTEEAPFWITTGDSAKVHMMTQTGTFEYAEDDHLQILELPYAGDDLSMVILLPRAVDGLGQIESALGPEQLDRWLGHLVTTKVKISLPRFKLMDRHWLKDALAAMGMGDGFDKSVADFSGIDGHKGKEKGLFLSEAIHQAIVEVNEEGTEASAATAIVVRSMDEAPPVFRADHPFLFLIRDRITGSILFMGRLVRPERT